MANSFASGGGFCAGSDVVTRHQRINSAAFVFSASLPVMFATTSSVALQILQERPAVFVTLAEYVQVFRLMVDKLDGITSPSHPLSPLVHLQLVRPVPVDQAGVEEEERLLQAIVQEALSNGVLLTRTRRLKGQEEVDVRSSIKISLSTALTRKEMDKAVWGVKAAVVKVLGRGRRGTDA
jgi:serine palmitoyltransferase